MTQKNPKRANIFAQKRKNICSFFRKNKKANFPILKKIIIAKKIKKFQKNFFKKFKGFHNFFKKFEQKY